jgi:hypothetical protein
MYIVSKKTRDDIVEWFKNKCDNSKLSKKTIGIMMRSFHMNCPIGFFLLILFAPKEICWIVIFLLICVLLMFFVFNGCIMSMIEHKICDDDFTIADPFLELLDLEKNTKNRYKISLFVGLSYYIIVGTVYYVRFS